MERIPVSQQAELLVDILQTASCVQEGLRESAFIREGGHIILSLPGRKRSSAVVHSSVSSSLDLDRFHRALLFKIPAVSGLSNMRYAYLLPIQS